MISGSQCENKDDQEQMASKQSNHSALSTPPTTELDHA